MNLIKKSGGNLSNKIACGIVKFRYIIIGLFTAAFIISLILVPKVQANYDISKYLPEDMETRQALSIVEKEFGLTSSVNVMVKGISKTEAQTLEKKFKVKYVSMVSFNPESTSFYNGGNALIKLMVDGGDYSDSVASVLESVETVLKNNGYTYYMNGSGVNGSRMQAGIGGEMTTIMLIALAVVLAILLLTSKSWFEPVIFLIVLAVSILINLGTNIILGEISYITKSIAAILQLALAMDYSIVLLHAYHKHCEDKPPRAAAASALKESFKPIISSSLTTIAGLMALVFMSFSIGRDIGIVMSKGIVISMLTVFLLMPGLLVIFSRPLKKLKHKPIYLGDKLISKAVLSSRFVLPVVLVGVIVTGAVLQSFNEYSFSEKQTSNNDNAVISEAFSSDTSMILLVPRANTAEDNQNITAATEELSKIKLHGKDVFVQAQTYSLALAAAGGESAPDVVKEKLDMTFNGENYSRIIFTFKLDGISDAAYNYLDDIKTVLTAKFGADNYIAGDVMSNYDIAKSFSSDILITNLITIIAILLIIALTFRSALLPVILVTVIQGAIFIAMAISFVIGQQIFFMSYIIGSAILMGATIDYAILVSNNYLKARQTFSKTDSVKHTIKQSLPTILTSGLILVIAGFIVGLGSSSYAISSIGLLLGRGALVSLLLITFLLPQLLYILDKPIQKLTFGCKNFNNHNNANIKDGTKQ